MSRTFSFWRIVISIAWAKSLTWAVTTETEVRTLLLAVNVVERNKQRGLELIIGPIKLIIGVV